METNVLRMETKSLLFALIAAVGLTGAVFTLERLPPDALLSAPDAVGMLLIGLLALGLDDHDTAQAPIGAAGPDGA